MNFSGNVLNSSIEKSPLIAADVVTAWQSVYLTLCFGGAVGNLLIASLIFFRRRLRTGCGLLIAHCLTAHTVLCLLCYPLTSITVYGVLVANWHVDIKYCGVAMWLQVSSQFAGNWIETTIAANRVVALCFPHQYRKVSNPRLINITIFVFWLSALLLGSIGYFGAGVQYFVLPMGACGIMTKNAFGVVAFTVGYYGPLALASACYSLVYLKMFAAKRRRKVAAEQSSQSADKASERGLKKANMVFVSFCWNAVCYLIFPVALAVAPEMFIFHPINPLLFGTVQILGYLTNPIIFFAMGPEYRTELRAICRSLGRKMCPSFCVSTGGDGNDNGDQYSMDNQFRRRVFTVGGQSELSLNTKRN